MSDDLAGIGRILDETPDAASRLQLRALEMATDGPVPALRSRLGADIGALCRRLAGRAPDDLVEVLAAFEKNLGAGPLGPEELSALFALLDGLFAIQLGEGTEGLRLAIAAGPRPGRLGGQSGSGEAASDDVGSFAFGKDGSL